MEGQKPQISDLGSARALRPWYLVAAMVLTWLVGVLGATSNCAHVSYLRGSQESVDRAEAILSEATDPMERLPAVVERARLAAMAEYHRLAFPASLAQTMLFIILALVSGAAIGGRRGARRFAIQVVLANAVLALVVYAVLDPVRQAVASAVAADALEHGGALANLETEPTPDGYRNAYLWAERIGLAMLVLGVYGTALLALTRKRTKQYFEAVADALANAEQPDHHD